MAAFLQTDVWRGHSVLLALAQPSVALFVNAGGVGRWSCAKVSLSGHVHRKCIRRFFLAVDLVDAALDAAGNIVRS